MSWNYMIELYDEECGIKFLMNTFRWTWSWLCARWSVKAPGWATTCTSSTRRTSSTSRSSAWRSSTWPTSSHQVGPGFPEWPLKLFWNTGLPVAQTRWVQSTFSSHCPLSYNQCRWLTSAALVTFPLKKFWECWESNPGLLGENQVCYLCAMRPPDFWSLLINELTNGLMNVWVDWLRFGETKQVVSKMQVVRVSARKPRGLCLMPTLSKKNLSLALNIWLSSLNLRSPWWDLIKSGEKVGPGSLALIPSLYPLTFHLIRRSWVRILRQPKYITPKNYEKITNWKSQPVSFN